jgi:hypothetical protein
VYHSLSLVLCHTRNIFSLPNVKQCKNVPVHLNHKLKMLEVCSLDQSINYQWQDSMNFVHMDEVGGLFFVGVVLKEIIIKMDSTTLNSRVNNINISGDVEIFALTFFF